MVNQSRAYAYAAYCANDTTGNVGRYVKKQCLAWLEIADGKSDAAYVSEKEYKRITGIMRIMIHPDLGKDMYTALEDYAFLFVVAVLCTYRKTGGRLYRTGILEIARKNFKTFTSGVIFIILLLTEPRFSRLFSVAPDYKLSSELRLAVRKIIKSSPMLAKHFKITRDMITCLLTETEYMPLAYSNDRLDGKLANAFLADEAGAMDSYPLEAMRSSQVTLKNKLGIVISTQYPNEHNAMANEIDYAKKILDGIGITDNVFALLYEPDDEIINKWETDDNVIYQANPVAVNMPEMFDDIKEKRAMAILYEDKRENFLCKHCNIKYKGLGTEGYVPIDKVQMCRMERDPAFWQGKHVYLGVDLSQTDDNSAVAMVTHDSDNDIIYARVMGFIPAGRVQLKSSRENFDYRRSIAAGDCIACGDEIIDYAVIENYVLNTIRNEYGAIIDGLGFDRYNAISSVQKFERAENPIDCTEIRQHSSVLHPATKKLREAILEKRFRYERNLLLENSFENARCAEDTNLNKYVNKKRSAGKVDMVVALINAVYMLIENDMGSDDFVCQYF